MGRAAGPTDPDYVRPPIVGSEPSRWPTLRWRLVLLLALAALLTLLGLAARAVIDHSESNPQSAPCSSPYMRSEPAPN